MADLRMYCIVRPMVPENNVPCTYHCLHVLSILVEDIKDVPCKLWCQSDA